MLAKVKPDPPSSDFEKARELYQMTKREEQATQTESDGLRAAAIRHRTSEQEWTSERMAWAREKIKDAYGDKPLPAEWRIPTLVRELEERISKARPRWFAAYQEWEIARSKETSRIAIELQPKQKQAVAEIADALRALNIAMKKEQAVRSELAQRAPLPTSAYLPDCAPRMGLLEDHTSISFEWRQRVRRYGILD